MASTPRRRRRSMDSPPSLSELMNSLIKHSSSFIREFNSSEQKMREIAGDFREISDEVREMQKRTDGVRTAGAVTGGVGIGLSVLAALFTGGASLLAAGALAVGGGAVVVGANVTKSLKENGSAKKVEELGKEFMEVVEPLKNDLEEIKRTGEELEERSAEDQAGKTLTDMEGFQRRLRQVSELARRSGLVLFFTVILMEVIKGMLLIIEKVFRVTATPEEDKKLTESIIQSADRCQEVVVKFDQMKTELKDFTEK